MGVDPADLIGHQILDYIVDPTLPSAQFHLSNGVVIKLDLRSHDGGPVTSGLDHALSQRLKALPDLPFEVVDAAVTICRVRGGRRQYQMLGLRREGKADMAYVYCIPLPKQPKPDDKAWFEVAGDVVLEFAGTHTKLAPVTQPPPGPNQRLLSDEWNISPNLGDAEAEGGDERGWHAVPMH